MKLTDKLKQAGKITLPFLLAGILLNPINAQDKEKSNDWLYHSLEASYIGLNVTDYINTHRVLENGAIEMNFWAKEMNPIAKHFIHNKPISALFKTGTTFGALYSCRKLKEIYPKLAYASLISLNLLYGQLVYHQHQLNLQFNLNNKK